MMICDLWWSATPCRSMVWALPLSLAATQGIDVSFSSSGYLDVSVHRVTSCMAIYSPYGTYTLLYVGSPIRTSADQRLFAPPRSLSQLVTSFFGSCCQGIRLMLLLAWPYVYLQMMLEKLAPRVGLEPTAYRLTAECSTIELPWNAIMPPETAILNMPKHG